MGGKTPSSSRIVTDKDESLKHLEAHKASGCFHYERMATPDPPLYRLFFAAFKSINFFQHSLNNLEIVAYLPQNTFKTLLL